MDECKPVVVGFVVRPDCMIDGGGIHDSHISDIKRDTGGAAATAS